MARVLIVTSDTVDAETLTIGAELRRRGHDVRVLGHASQYGMVAAARLGFAALAVTPEGSSPDVRALDPRLALEVAAETARRAPDLIVVGATLLTALKAALGTGAPVAVLVAGRFTDVATWASGPVRLAARLRRVRPATLWAAAARLLVTADAQLDPTQPPAGAVRTGPAIGEVRTRVREFEPLVVVDGVPVPEGLDGIAEVVEKADPDALSRAWLHVGDGSHAATMRALANDLPVLAASTPLAGAVVAAGAGRLAGGDAAADVPALLAEGAHHAAAAAVGARVRAAGGAAAAADALEALLPPS